MVETVMGAVVVLAGLVSVLLVLYAIYFIASLLRSLKDFLDANTALAQLRVNEVKLAMERDKAITSFTNTILKNGISWSKNDVSWSMGSVKEVKRE